MLLRVAGSSSSGNTYLLENKDTCLIIEAGISPLVVKEYLNFNISKIIGVLCSHGHLDHSKYVKDYLTMGIPVYTSQDTANAIKLKSFQKPIIFNDNKQFKIDKWTILPFPVQHNVTCHGFYISHPETGDFIFVTDSYYVPYIFKGLRHLLVEANYDDEIIRQKIANNESVAYYHTDQHLSLDMLKEYLSTIDLSTVINIVLLHLSSGNSNANQFKKDIEKQTGKHVVIADKDVVVDLNLIPF